MASKFRIPPIGGGEQALRRAAVELRTQGRELPGSVADSLRPIIPAISQTQAVWDIPSLGPGGVSAPAGISLEPPGGKSHGLHLVAVSSPDVTVDSGHTTASCYWLLDGVRVGVLTGFYTGSPGSGLAYTYTDTTAIPHQGACTLSLRLGNTVTLPTAPIPGLAMTVTSIWFN